MHICSVHYGFSILPWGRPQTVCMFSFRHLSFKLTLIHTSAKSEMITLIRHVSHRERCCTRVFQNPGCKNSTDLVTNTALTHHPQTPQWLPHPRTQCRSSGRQHSSSCSVQQICSCCLSSPHTKTLVVWQQIQNKFNPNDRGYSYTVNNLC